MWLKVYDFITKAQAKIGDGAEVRLSAREGILVICADLPGYDYHVLCEVSEEFLTNRADEIVLGHIDGFIGWCRAKRITMNEGELE